MNTVFLVSAVDDLKTAEIVARKLRALKMKVTFDKKRGERSDSTTFSSKDAAAREKTDCMLVLWSKAADESDWVHAAARAGRSDALNSDDGHPYKLIQAALDDVTPREPFSVDDRYDLSGITARKQPSGWLDTVDALGSALQRPGLRDWAGYGAKDQDEKEAWLAKYKDDPLAGAAPSQANRAEAGPWPPKWDPASAAGLPFGVKNTLSLIGGVSDASERKLEDAGVSTLEQVATLSRDDAEALEDKTKIRRGTIERGEWVMQARELLDGKPPRAKVDLDDWRQMQLDAYQARYAGEGGGVVGLAGVPGDGTRKAKTDDAPAAAGVGPTALAATAAAAGFAKYGDWRPAYGTSKMPEGVSDDIVLVGGITQSNAEIIRGRGYASLTQIASLEDEDVSLLEGELGFTAGKIDEMEWRQQSHELLMGRPPRATTDKLLWDRMRSGEGAVAAGGLASTAASTNGANGQDEGGIRLGTIAAILGAVILMLGLAWWFAKEEREMLLASNQTCPAGFYPASYAPLEPGTIINDTN